jgi:integrase/recombinase XerD
MSGRAVRQLADHDHKSPDRITEAARRADCLSLKHVKHSSRNASTIALGGLKFFDAHTLQRAWTTLTCVRPPREKQLPVILSPTAVRPILAGVPLPRYRICRSTRYACGLRLQEGTPLQVSDLDSARMCLHVRLGKGAKDRYVPLPRRLLERLRQSWVTPRHPLWSFPAPGRGGTGLATATKPRPRSRVPDAFRAALRKSGLAKRAGLHTLRHSWATHLRKTGVPLRLIQAYLGQIAPATTALYPHLPLQAQEMAGVALHRLMEDLGWSNSQRASAGMAPPIGPNSRTQCCPALCGPWQRSNTATQQRLAVTSISVNTAKSPRRAIMPAKPAIVPPARTALPMRGCNGHRRGSCRSPIAWSPLPCPRRCGNWPAATQSSSTTPASALPPQPSKRAPTIPGLSAERSG